VSRRLQRNLRAHAESRDERFHSAGYEYLKIDEYIPILDIPPKNNTISGSLSDVAILGSFRFNRREYGEIYADLLKSLQGEYPHFDTSFDLLTLLFSEDPQVWGYLPLQTPDSVYEIDNTSSLPPLVLHLIGNADDPQVPPTLSNVIRIHRDLDYPDYFSLIQTMDLIFPGFATLECKTHPPAVFLYLGSFLY
jgi:hypothetical protein